MATPYSDIYTSFMSKVTDYDLAKLEVEDVENILEKYLVASISKFTLCKQDLSDRDSIEKKFNITLSEIEIEILANQMVIEWLSPTINSSNILKQVLADKDFRLYSQANHLKELIQLKNDRQNDVDSLLMAYSYSDTKLLEEL